MKQFSSEMFCDSIAVEGSKSGSCKEECIRKVPNGFCKRVSIFVITAVHNTAGKIGKVLFGWDRCWQVW